MPDRVGVVEGLGRRDAGDDAEIAAHVARQLTREK